MKKRFTYNKLVKEDWRIGKVKEMKSKLMETQRNAKKNSRKWRKSLNMKRKRLFKVEEMPNDEKSKLLQSRLEK